MDLCIVVLIKIKKRSVIYCYSSFQVNTVACLSRSTKILRGLFDFTSRRRVMGVVFNIEEGELVVDPKF